MKKYTFTFYPFNTICTITITSSSKGCAERLLREMIPDHFFDDGLCFVCEEE